MLSEKVCKACREDAGHGWTNASHYLFVDKAKEGAFCFRAGSRINSSMDPPEECPYKLEHSVAKGMNRAK